MSFLSFDDYDDNDDGYDDDYDYDYDDYDDNKRRRNLGARAPKICSDRKIAH